MQAKFAAMPATIHFVFGWNDANGHVNCINPDFGDGADLAHGGVEVGGLGLGHGLHGDRRAAADRHRAHVDLAL